MEVVEAAEAAETNPNANVNETEKQAQQEKDAVKNAPPENPADQAVDDGGGQVAPDEVADVNAQVEQLLQGDLPDTGADIGVDQPVTDVVDLDDDDTVDVLVNDSPYTISTDRELVVINGTVPDKEAILAELKVNQDVLILEDGNGLDELNAYLDEHADVKYSAIHLVTHGDDGKIIVNEESVTMENFNAEEWAQVGEHLTSDGDILLYGCDTAKSVEGQLLVDKIAAASGADVAASDDATGIHGDWNLEYTIGNVEHDAIAVDSFDYDLASSYTVTSIEDSGEGTLRYALAQGSSDITFHVDGRDTITLESELTITSSVTIDGLNQGTGSDGVEGNSFIRIQVTEVGRIYNASSVDWVDNESASNYRVFTASGSSNITLRNLLLNGGYTDNGGTIYFEASSVTLDHVMVSGSRADESGGGVYIRAKGANILYSSICGNKSGESGSGLSLGIEGVEGVYGYSIIESTIAKNQCIIPSGVNGGGGALYILASPIEKANYSIINSTIVSNTTNKGCAGIRAVGIIQDMMQFSLVNSIVLGNYTGSNQRNMEVLEQVSAHYTNSLYADDVNLSTVFEGDVPSLAGDLKSVPLATNGPAVLGGTLAGMIGTECYYKSGSKWIGTVSGTEYTYDSSASDYGLTGGTVYTTALNGVSRVASDEIFTMGSTAYKMETGALEVNTRDGALNFFDGWISLADAIYYAQHGLTDANGNYNITFSDGMFRQDDVITNFSVTIDADSFSASKPLTIDGRNAVILDGESTRQLFNIAAGNSVVLSNMTVQNSKGSAITNAGTLTIANLIFSGNKISATDGNGGAIYNSGNLDISNSTFHSNIASMNGGAIYNTGTLAINNSTFFGNTAQGGNGGAIYNADETATLTLVNSTVTGNTGVRFGTGIDNNMGTLFLLNSIVAGNIGTSSNTVYDIYAASGQNISAYYSTLGTIRKNVAEGTSALTVSIGTTINNTALDVFGTTSPALDSKNTVPLSGGGTATLSGTLVGKIGNDFYYKDGETWKSFSNETTYAFHASGTNYGLGGTAAVFTTGQNGVTRVASLDIFNAGAYALQLESASTTVSLTSDEVNPFDGKISLREAIAYASAGDTITFSSSVFSTVQTITLHSELTIGKSLSIDGAGKVILDGGHTAENDGCRILSISAGNTVTLSNLTFQNGYTGSGGAISSEDSTLTIVNSTFSGNNASQGGAIYHINGTLTIVNSTISGNFADDDLGGGAIYIAGGSAYFLNSIIAGNVATGKSSYDIHNSGTTMKMDYCVYGAYYGSTVDSTKTSSGVSASDVFSINTLTDGMLEITVSGKAANNGTLIGKIGEAYYYYDQANGYWSRVSDNGRSSYVFDNSDTETYGLTDGTIFSSAQNGVSRVLTTAAFNIGAYALMPAETASLTVNTTADLEANPFVNDGKISLREAIAYAGTNNLGNDIIFNLASSEGRTIALSSALIITKEITIDGINTNDGNIGNVILDGKHTAGGSDGSRIIAVYAQGSATLSNLTFLNGYSSSGGAIYNLGTVTVNNSTFSGNVATSYGNAIYSDGILTVINSTFLGNTESGDVGTIYTGNGIRTSTSLINSILVGNGTDLINYGTTTAYYCVYGLSSGYYAVGGSNNIAGATMTDVFGTNTLSNGIIAIPEDGIAAKSGTKLQNDNGNLQYWNGETSTWQTVSTTTLTTGQLQVDQLGANRTTGPAAQSGLYAAGAYFVETMPETKSLVVNTTDDVYNPYDGVISLREAIAYAGTDNLGNDITFDSTVFATAQTITVTSALTIDKSITIDGAGKVILDGGNAVQIMSIEQENIVTLSNLTFQNGKATSGGAIYNANGGTLTVNSSTFSGNSASRGGAIYNDEDGTLTVNSSTFSGNSASTYGGAIYNAEDGMLTVNSSTFSGNSASRGSAIYNYYASMTIANSTFANNTTGSSSSSGGAIYNYYGSMTIANSTFANNTTGSSSSGGAIYNFNNSLHGSVYLLNSIFVGNSGDDLVNKTNSDYGVMNAYYCVYGTASGTIGGANNVSGATASDVFGSNTFDGKTIAIADTGAAANSGTLTAVKDGVYYFKDGANGWKKLSDGSTTTEDMSAYAINTDQLGNSRLGDAATYGVYSVGAVFVNAAQEAKSLVVDLTTDTVNPYDGKYSLREAITYAGTDSLGNNITFDSAVFATAQTITVTSTLTIDKDLTIDGAGKVVLDGGHTATSAGGRIMLINSDNTAVLRNLTFQNGKVDERSYGAAIFNIGSLTIENSTFQANAGGYGGAINNSGTMTVANSYFSKNSVEKTGGAIHNNGTMTVENSYFSENSSDDGGAITSYGTIDIKDTTFRKNSSISSGGAFYSNSGQSSVENSVFDGNSAGKSGGAIATNGRNTAIEVINSTFSGNTASENYGGAIINGSTAYIVNSTFSGNSAGKSGGAIVNNGRTCHLLNSIFVGNTVQNTANDITAYSTAVTNAYYCLVGNISAAGKEGLEAFTNSIGTKTGILAGDVFADVTDGKAVLTADGTFRIKADSIAACSGTLAAKDSFNLFFFDKDNSAWKYLAYPTNTADIAQLTIFDKDQTGISRTTGEAASLGFYAAGASFVEAATETKSLVVTTTDDVYNPYDGKISLREAIVYAGTGELGNNITFDSTVFATAQTITVTSTLTINKDLTINGEGNVILDGGHTATTEGVLIMQIVSGNTVTLNKLTFQNGCNNLSSVFGGALNNSGGTLTVNDSIFSDNSTNNTGGAIHNASGMLTVNNSTFSGNSALSGGVIYNGGTLAVTNSTFSGNSTTIFGGAIVNNGTLTVTDSTFSGNSALSGGAIYNVSGTLTVNNSTFSGNTATGNGSDGRGGAIYNDGAEITLIGSTFIENSATNDGGAIYGLGGTLTVNNSSFSGNSASLTGGAIQNGGTLTVNNSTFSGNSATSGGAIFNGFTLTVNNSTFSGNSASSGGAIYNDKTLLTIANSTFSNNSVTNTGIVYNSNATAYLINSIFVGNTGTDLYSTSDWGGAYNNAYYCIYESADNNIKGSNNITGEQATVDNVFAEITDGKAVLNSDGTFHIKADGLAARSGTKLQNDGNGNLQYFDGSAWQTITTTTLTNEQLQVDQLGANRTTGPAAQSGLYAAGAYFVEAMPETKSLVVNTTDDVYNPYDGVISLREAIAYAGTDNLGNDITFDANVFATAQTITLTSTLTIDKDLTIDGAGNVILDGGHPFGGYVGYQILSIENGTTVTLSNLTFQKGYSNEGSSAIQNSGTLTVNNSNFIDNVSHSYGTIYNNGILTVNNSTFSGNSATSCGGAIYNFNGTLTVNNSTFSGNSAASDGGAIWNSGKLTVNNSTFSGNSAASCGGAIYNYYGSMTIANSTFANNRKGSFYFGGAIYNFNNSSHGSVYLLNSIFVGNSADDLVNSDDGVLNAYYCVYGSAAGMIGGANNVSGATASDVFGSNAFDGKTIAIADSGAAANSGTLTAVKDGVYYFKDGANGWKKLSDGSTTTEDLSSNAINTDQLANSRLGDAATYGVYSVGAVFVNAAKEAKGIIVNTTDGKLNPYDGKISLHDAVAYAGLDSLGYNITFADSIFTDGKATITLASDIVFANTLSGKAVTINGGDGRVVTVKAQVTYAESVANNTTASNYRVFTIGTDSDRTHIWNLSLTNMTLQGGAVDGDGGAIYMFGADSYLTLDNVTISGSKAGNDGGGIALYAKRNSGTATLLLNMVNSTVTGNTAGASGGGIATITHGDNSSPSSLTINLVNSTVSNNCFGNFGSFGGGIYAWANSGNNAATLMVNLVDSSIVGNYSPKYSQYAGLYINNAAYTSNDSVTTVNLLNSVVFGNTAKGAELYIKKSRGSLAFNTAYSVYGTCTTTPNSSVGCPDMTGKTIADVFVLEDGKIKYENGIPVISGSGAAANSGTLTGKVGSDYYYKDGDTWKSFTSETTYTFDSTGTNYGLGDGATVYTTGQNGVSRVATLSAFNAGAYALALETASTVVTTTGDISNPFAGSGITLREAISYATVYETITFDATIFAEKQTITVNSTLTIDKNLTIDGAGKVILDGGNSGNGATDGVRIMSISLSKIVELSSLIFQNGYSKDGGGAIYNNGGSLTVNNSTFSGNSATSGGAIYNAFGMLTVNNSTFSGNSASISGGAIFNKSALTITNSTFSENSATSGGAIYNDRNTLTIANSTFSNNSVTNTGIVYNSNATAYLINSIFVGNTGTDLYSTSDFGGAYNNAYYCIYESANDNIRGSNNITGEQATVDNVFENVDTETGKAILNADGTFHIKADGIAARSGTKLQNSNGNLQYFDGSAWQTITTTTLTTEQLQVDQLGNNRNDTSDVNKAAKYGIYAAGAYFVNATPEAASTVVDLATDTVNPYDGKYSLREAIAYAAANDTITFDTTAFGTEQTITFTSTLAIDKSLTIDGAGNVILDGGHPFGGYTGCQILSIENGTTVTLSNLTFQNGYSNEGSAIKNSGTLTVNNSTFSGNSAVSSGGAIYNSNGTLTLNNSTFSGNSAVSSGGAIYNFNGTLTVNNSTFSGNYAASDGGAIYNYSGMLTVNNSIFFENYAASSGGAIYNYYGSMTIANSTFSNNTKGSSYSGGAIYNLNNSLHGSVYLLNSIFVGNSDNDLYNSGDGVMNAYYCVYGSAAGMIGGANNYVGLTTAIFADAANGDYTLSSNANPAAVNGVKTGIDANGNVCYDNGSGWVAVSGATVTGNVTEYTLDLAGNTRGTISYVGNYYSAGAYQALALDTETGSTIVTTVNDVVNAYDGVISFREAATKYASAGDTISFATGNGTLTLNSAVTIDKNITIGDNFNISTVNADGKLFTVASGASLTLNNVTLGDGTIDGEGTLGIASDKTVTAGNLAVNTANFANSGTLAVSGNLSAPNVSNFGNVTYNGTSDQTVLSGTYATLTLAGSGTTKTVSGNGNLTINSLSNSDGATLAISGKLVQIYYTSNWGNVTYNGADQTILTGTYNTLTLTGSGTKDLQGYIETNTLAVTGDASHIVTLDGKGTPIQTKALTADYAKIKNLTAFNTIDAWNATVQTNTVTAENCTNLTVKLGGVTFSGSEIEYGQNLKDNSTITASYSLFGENATMTVSTTDTTLYHVAHNGSQVIAQTQTVDVSAEGYAFGYTVDYAVTFTVNPKELIVNWGNNTYTYNGAEQTVTPTVDSSTLIGSDTLTLSVDFGGTLFKNAGDYTAYASTINHDYSLLNTAKDLTIAKKEISVSDIAASDKVYDGTTDVKLNFSSISISGLIGTETLVVSASGTFVDTNVGIGKTVNLQLTLGNGTGLAANYAIKSDSQTSTTADITQRNLTISADQFTIASKVYDGTTSAGTTSHAFDAASGLVAGDSVNLTYSAMLDDKDVNDVTKVIFDTFSLDNGNYTFTATSVDKVQSGLITQKELTVTANTQTITYGKSADLIDYGVTGWVAGESENLGAMIVQGALSGAGKLTAGTHALDGSALVSTSGNYSVAFTSAAVTVNKLNLNVSITGTQEKIYDGSTLVEAADQTWTHDALAGDVIGLASANWAYDTKHAVNGKNVTMSEIVLNGADVGNYNLVADSVTAASGKVTAKAITVTVTDQADTTYGDAVTPAFTHSGLASGDNFTGNLEISGDKSTSGNWIVGNHDITQGTLAIADGNEGKNYTLNFVGDSFNVGKLALTNNVTFDTSKVYDGTTNVNNVSGGLSNVIANDAVTLNKAFAYNSANVTDATTISATQWNLSGDDAANYDLAAFTPVNGSITAKTVDAAWSDKAPYYYNAKDQGNTILAFYTDIAGQSINLNVAFSGKGTVFREAGEYTASVESSDSNYAISAQTQSRSYVMIAVSTGNADTYTQGLNWNYDATIPAILGNALVKGQATSPTEGNLYTAPYSTLISATEINGAEPRNADVKIHFSEAILWNKTSPWMDHEGMTVEDISTGMSTSVIGISQIVKSDGFSRGRELFSGLETDFGALRVVNHESEVFTSDSAGSTHRDERFEFLRQTIRMHRAFFLNDASEADAVVPGYELGELPGIDLPRKSDMFKSDFERLLDEMQVIA